MAPAGPAAGTVVSASANRKSRSGAAVL